LLKRYAIVGAILLTAYLGGATATHVLSGIGAWWFPVMFGCLVWASLLARKDVILLEITRQFFYPLIKK
jgi:hypothetical protein